MHTCFSLLFFSASQGARKLLRNFGHRKLMVRRCCFWRRNISWVPWTSSWDQLSRSVPRSMSLRRPKNSEARGLTPGQLPVLEHPAGVGKNGTVPCGLAFKNEKEINWLKLPCTSPSLGLLMVLQGWGKLPPGAFKQLSFFLILNMPPLYTPHKDVKGISFCLKRLLKGNCPQPFLPRQVR